MDLESQIRHVHGPEEVTYGPDELVVVCLVRDGRPYLKSFVEHYSLLGAKHIAFLDNGSTDGTVEALKDYENVTILQTGLPFKKHKGYMRQYLVARFGSRGRWVLCVDVDELFDYPYSDVVGLSPFLGYLTEKSYTAVVGQMLDMFPEKTVLNAAAREDEPLKELHRFYDISNVTRHDYYLSRHSRRRRYSNTLASDEIEVYRNGIRRTLFGNSANLTKHPLIFLDEKIRSIDHSSHWVGGARIADIMCVLFHYKFIGDFYERALRAVKEENYGKDSFKYKLFLETLERTPELQIKLETAQELKDVNDLVDNQFLVVSGDYMAWVDAEERRSRAANTLSDGEPRRLVEAFSQASARAKTQAKVAENLERRVEKLENSLAKERRRNRDLEREIRNIQDSRSWKLLGKLGRTRAWILGKGWR